MDKLISYLKDKLHLSDEIVEVVLANIKVKYVIPTYYYDDLLFSDLNVLDDIEDKDFYNIGEFNDPEFSTIIYKIVINNGINLIPEQGSFSHLKAGEEYWAIYRDGPPINIVIDSISKQVSWVWYSYNIIRFVDKTNNNKLISFWDEDKNKDALYLFSTRAEAVKFYKDKFDLN